MVTRDIELKMRYNANKAYKGTSLLLDDPIDVSRLRIGAEMFLIVSDKNQKRIIL